MNVPVAPECRIYTRDYMAILGLPDPTPEEFLKGTFSLVCYETVTAFPNRYWMFCPSMAWPVSNPIRRSALCSANAHASGVDRFHISFTNES